MSSRDKILDLIRAADVPQQSAKRSAAAKQPVDVDLFVQRLLDYRATVHRCSPDEVLDLIRRLTEGLSTVCSPDFPAEIQAELKDLRVDENLTPSDLDGVDTAVTLCALAIEESGSIILDGGPGQGRRAISLIPDHHICIVREDQIVGSISEAVAKLSSTVAAGQPLTWISGPSATSDIELVRVEGVHGPRRLEVVVVGAAGA